MKISDQCVVAIHYTLRNGAGEVLDSSRGAQPLSYLHGAGGIIPGLERELLGQEVGASLDVTVQPADGYGEAHPQLVQEVPLSALAGIEGLAVGMQLQARGPDGQTRQLVVDAIGDETATLNGNHPLAGQVLHFEVTIEGVRAATEEELAHGHVH